MKVDQGITNVPSAGTAVQVLNTKRGVLFVKFRALTANSGKVYVGLSDVSASLGYELAGGNELELNFGEFDGTVPAEVFYVDAATNDDKVSWIMILRE